MAGPPQSWKDKNEGQLAVWQGSEEAEASIWEQDGHSEWSALPEDEEAFGLVPLRPAYASESVGELC